MRPAAAITTPSTTIFGGTAMGRPTAILDVYEEAPYIELADDISKGADVRQRAGEFLLAHPSNYPSGVIARRFNKHGLLWTNGTKWTALNVTETELRARCLRGYAPRTGSAT